MDTFSFFSLFLSFPLFLTLSLLSVFSWHSQLTEVTGYHREMLIKLTRVGIINRDVSRCLKNGVLSLNVYNRIFGTFFMFVLLTE